MENDELSGKTLLRISGVLLAAGGLLTVGISLLGLLGGTFIGASRRSLQQGISDSSGFWVSVQLMVYYILSLASALLQTAAGAVGLWLAGRNRTGVLCLRLGAVILGLNLMIIVYYVAIGVFHILNLASLVVPAAFLWGAWKMKREGED